MNRNQSFSFQETGGGGSMAIAYGFSARLHRPGIVGLDDDSERCTQELAFAEGWRDWLSCLKRINRRYCFAVFRFNCIADSQSCVQVAPELLQL